MITEQAKKIGEALVSAQIITQDQLENATRVAVSEKSSSLLTILVNEGVLPFRIFEKFLLSAVGIKAAIIGEKLIKKDVLNTLDETIIREKQVFPIEGKLLSGNKKIIVGMVDPLDTETIEKLKAVTKAEIIPVLISLPDFRNALRTHFRAQGFSYANPSGRSSLDEKSKIDIGHLTNSEKMILVSASGHEDERSASHRMVTKVPQNRVEKLELDLDNLVDLLISKGVITHQEIRGEHTTRKIEK